MVHGRTLSLHIKHVFIQLKPSFVYELNAMFEVKNDHVVLKVGMSAFHSHVCFQNHVKLNVLNIFISISGRCRAL